MFSGSSVFQDPPTETHKKPETDPAPGQDLGYVLMPLWGCHRDRRGSQRMDVCPFLLVWVIGKWMRPSSLSRAQGSPFARATADLGSARPEYYPGLGRGQVRLHRGCGVTWASPRVVGGRLEASGPRERRAEAARPSPGPLPQLRFGGGATPSWGGGREGRA